MEKYIGLEYSKKQRELFLKDNCSTVEEKGYMKQFTPEQLNSHKENLANASIEIDEIEAEKKATAEFYKGKLKPLIEQRHQMISNIKAKAEYVREICYKFVDEVNKEVGYYNVEGQLIETRPANFDELQPTLFTLKTGTND